MKSFLIVACLLVCGLQAIAAEPPPIVAEPAAVTLSEPVAVVAAGEPVAVAAAPVALALVAAPQPVPESDAAIAHAALDVLSRLDLGNLFSVGSLALLITALTLLSRLGFIGDFLAAQKLGWVRPLIAVILGAASGAVSALQAGTPVLTGLVGGILVGLSSIGAFESLRLLSPKARAEVRVSKSAANSGALAMEEQAAAAAVKAEVSSAAVNAKIADAAALPPGKRLEELAKLASNPALAERK